MSSVVYVDVFADCCLPLGSCSQDVYLCLEAGWEAKTTSGYPFAEGKVINCCVFEQDYVGSGACGSKKYTKKSCRYQVEIDVTQFGNDPDTGTPYVPCTDDVVDIFPYSCVLSAILTSLNQEVDPFTCAMLADCIDGVTITQNGAGGTLQAEFPAEEVIVANDTSTINLTASGTANHTLEAAVKVSATGGNVIQVNADGLYVPAGGVAVIVSGDADNELIIGGDGGAYIDCDTIAACVPADVPLQTVTSLDNCSGGIGSNFMIKSASVSGGGSTLTLNSAPEHRSIHIDALQALDIEGVVPNGVNTVIGGSETTPHLVVNNPSTCRAMPWTAIPRCQITVNPIADGTTTGILMQMRVNGGSWINVVNSSREDVPNGQSVQIGFPDPLRGTIPAGGSVQFDTRAVSNSNGNGNTCQYAFPDVNFIGTTT